MLTESLTPYLPAILTPEKFLSPRSSGRQEVSCFRDSYPRGILTPSMREASERKASEEPSKRARARESEREKGERASGQRARRESVSGGIERQHTTRECKSSWRHEYASHIKNHGKTAGYSPRLNKNPTTTTKAQNHYNPQQSQKVLNTLVKLNKSKTNPI